MTETTSDPLYYDSSTKRSDAIGEFSEIWRYRDLLRLLVINSIKTRYKRSALGVVWTLLNPLLNTAVLTIALSSLFRFNIQNYPIYLLSGLILWNFFAQTTTVAMSNLVWGSNLIKRIYVPRTIFAISVLGNGIINLLLAIIPLSLTMLVMRQPITSAVIFLPAAILITSMFTLGMSLLISTWAVFFADIVDIYGVLISAWFYLTPIIYPADVFPARFSWILKLNPMAYFLDLFRVPIFQGSLPGYPVILSAIGIAGFTLCIGWWLFTREAAKFAYRL